jgi:CheY-like chemotaxis protein
MIAMRAQRILSDHFDVTTARSVEDAPELLEGGAHADIILCDLMMPGKTGIDLHDYMKEHHPADVGSLIFMTGGALTQKGQSFLDRADIRHITKPFQASELQDFVREAFEARERS